MKVFLLQSYLGRPEKPIYPLGLAYLGACLADHDLQAFDPNVSSDPYGELAQKLETFGPDVVGISLRNVDTTQYRDPFVYLSSLQLTLDIISHRAPQARRIIGGAGFSIYAQGIMERFPAIDYGVMLEGEESFPALLADLDHPESTPGIYYRQNGQIQLSGSPVLPDFDAMPSPRWDVVNLEPYKRQIDAFGIQAKRGCGLKCAYCTYCFLNGAHYRLRNPQKIAAEIGEFIARFGIDHFIFVDSVFNIPPKHARQICEELIRQKIKIPWTAWYNDREFDEDFLKLAKAAGCKYFSFSPDAYSDRALRMLQKNLRVEDIRRVYRMAKRENALHFGWNFFVNPPGQTYLDFIRLMIFWLNVRFNLRDRLYGFGLGNIRIEPDTEIYRIARREGLLDQDSDLLPHKSDELRELFYTNPKTPLINWFFGVYGFLASLKHRLRP